MLDDTLVEDILEYEKLMNDEYGEGLQHLIQIYVHPYLYSEEFNEQVEKELRTQLHRLQTEFVITEKEVTIPARKIKRIEVEYIGDEEVNFEEE